MRLLTLAKYWPALLSSGLALGALALLWRVRDMPLALGAFARFDALSAFFLFVLFGGSALVLAARPKTFSPQGLRPAAAVGALALAFSTTSTLVIACAYLALALLTLDWQALALPAEDRQPTPANSVRRALRRAVPVAPNLLAAACLLLGCGALALRGAARYDDRTAGAALDSFAFWFMLLAALIPLIPLSRAEDQAPSSTNQVAIQPLWFSALSTRFLHFAWLYPLTRLYSLGPWNSGWSFATLLLGGALALWCASSALTRLDVVAGNTKIQSMYLALALAGLGLSNSAGLVAACFGILTYLVLCVGHGDWELARDEAPSQSPVPELLPWLLSSALPLTAPFVAVWMLIGASVAGGVSLLAGVAWLVALLHGLTMALWNGAAPVPARRPLLVAGVVSVVLGVGAPPIARLLILPVVAQLQGGLTPFGDLNIWPWVGVATSDSNHTQVTTLPSIAITLLMLVLAALVYVVRRLRELRRAEQPAEQPAVAVSASTLLGDLRDEVPWLGGLLGANSRSQRHPGDGE
ncbi:MAG: hypothetical protein M3R61_02880 [Chloroflexota bacterium]|nr:hypothetical protein [Chloroflexota bacterium]